MRRLTICQRDDGLFFYQEDWFSEWDMRQTERRLSNLRSFRDQC